MSTIRLVRVLKFLLISFIFFSISSLTCKILLSCMGSMSWSALSLSFFCLMSFSKSFTNFSYYIMSALNFLALVANFALLELQFFFIPIKVCSSPPTVAEFFLSKSVYLLMRLSTSWFFFPLPLFLPLFLFTCLLYSPLSSEPPSLKLCSCFNNYNWFPMFDGGSVYKQYIIDNLKTYLLDYKLF